MTRHLPMVNLTSITNPFCEEVEALLAKYCNQATFLFAVGELEPVFLGCYIMKINSNGSVIRRDVMLSNH